jgi:outer membrane cobalamin receptor
VRTTSLLLPLLLGSFFVVYSNEIQDLGESEVFLTNEDSSFAPQVVIFKDAWEGKAISLGEVLSSHGSIQSDRQGGLGSFERISIRGASANGIKVFIDGIELVDPGGGAVNLGSIDLALIEKIEVYKGYVPAFLGGNGIGGAIHLISKKRVNTGGDLQLFYGSHRYQGASFSLFYPLSPFIRASSSVSYRYCDNDYEFLNRNGTEYNTEDDFLEKRKNAWYRSFSGTHSLYKTHSNSLFSTITLRHKSEKGGNPGKESNQTEVAGFDRDFGFLYYALEGDWRQNYTFQVSLSGQIEKSMAHFYYPLDKIGFPHPHFMQYGAIHYFLEPKINLERLQSKSSSWKAGVHISSRIEELQKRDNNQILSAYDWRLNRSTLSFVPYYSIQASSFLNIQTEASLQAFKNKNTGGVSYLPIQNDTIDASSSFYLLHSERLALHLGEPKHLLQGLVSLGHYFREPQLMQLYGVYRNTLPNHHLKAETGITAELGFDFKSPSQKSKVSLQYFETHQKNGVYWLSNHSFSKAYNLNRSRVRGVEASLQSQVFSFLHTRLQSTFQNALDKSSQPIYQNKRLPDQAFRSHFAEFTVSFPYQIEWAFQMEFRGHFFKDRANLQKIPAQAIYHSHWSLGLFNKSKLYFSIQNLGDSDYQNIYSAFPLPGRTYSLSFVHPISFSQNPIP